MSDDSEEENQKYVHSVSHQKKSSIESTRKEVDKDSEKRLSWDSNKIENERNKSTENDKNDKNGENIKNGKKDKRIEIDTSSKNCKTKIAIGKIGVDDLSIQGKKGGNKDLVSSNNNNSVKGVNEKENKRSLQKGRTDVRTITKNDHKNKSGNMTKRYEDDDDEVHSDDGDDNDDSDTNDDNSNESICKSNKKDFSFHVPNSPITNKRKFGNIQKSLDQCPPDSSSNSSVLSGKKKMHNDVEVYEKKDGKGIVIQSNHVSKKQNVISNFNRKNVNGSANNEIDELESGAASNVKSSLLTGKKVRRSIVCDEEDDDDEIINTQDDDKSYNDRNRNKLMKEKRKLSETFPIRQSSLSSSSSSSPSPSPSSPSPFSFARTAQSTAVRGTVHDQHSIREKPKHSGKIVGKLTVKKITSAAEESRETDENSENQNVDEYSTASYKRGRADSPCW